MHITCTRTHTHTHTHTHTTHRCTVRPANSEIFPHVGNDVKSNKFKADKAYLTGNFPGPTR